MAESRIPRIMEPAPDFDAKSTHGPIRLSDYTSKGKWVMLFSHPSDFTPVCSTEFIEFARRSDDFDREAGHRAVAVCQWLPARRPYRRILLGDRGREAAPRTRRRGSRCFSC